MDKVVNVILDIIFLSLRNKRSKIPGFGFVRMIKTKIRPFSISKSKPKIRSDNILEKN